MIKRKIAVLLALLLAFSLCAAAAMPSKEPVDDLATRGYSAESIIKGLSAHNIQIVKGYSDDGTDLQLDKPINRVEVLVMLARALPKLPESTLIPSFTDVPAWATADIAKLSAAGIVKGYSPTTLGARDDITIRQLLTLIERSKDYADVKPYDDFYQAVNKKWFQDGRFSDSFSEASSNAYTAVYGIVRNTTSSDARKTAGSDEQRIADMYETCLNWTARDTEGLSLLQEYLDGIDAAETMDEFMQVMTDIKTELGTDALFRLYIDYTRAGDPRLQFYDFTPLLSYDNISSGAKADMLENYLLKLFTASGMSDADAKEAAALTIDFNKILVKDSLSAEQFYNGVLTSNYMSKEQFASFFPELDMAGYLDAIGFDFLPGINVIQLVNARTVGEKLTMANLKSMKAYTKATLLDEFSYAATKEIFRARVTFTNRLYGSAEAPILDESYAVSMCINYLSTPLEKMYIKGFFSEKAKDKTIDMVEEILAVYETRLLENPWLSEASKKASVEKLQAITMNIGYPDEWYDETAGAVVTGESFMKNYISICVAHDAEAIRNAKSGDRKKGFGMNVFECNAFYSPMENSINFPAGILQAPFFSTSYKDEENYAKIGVVIAHEISHAFDSNGAKIDANGNPISGWTAAELAMFDSKCLTLQKQFDNAVLEYNAVVNGEQIIFEAVADSGAVSCTLEILKGMKNPDYNRFFQGYASLWREKTTPEHLAAMVAGGVHPPSKLRVNMILANFREFYDTYDVQETHGMYIPPEERVIIW